MWRKIALTLSVVMLAGGLSLPALAKDGDPLVGTWYSRERPPFASNSFYLVDAPIGGVYPVLFYDDHSLCPDGGPWMWAGLGAKTDDNTLLISFGQRWCPAIGDHEIDGPGPPDVFHVNLTYNPENDTINEPFSVCEGTRQPHIKTLEKAIHELAKGKFPPTGVDVGCDF